MKTTHSLMLALVGTFIALRADAPPVANVVANATNQFTIKGLSCNGCAHGLASELGRTAGVATAEVSFTNKLAVVAYDTNRVTAARLKKVIGDAGYAAKLVKPTSKPSR